MTQTDTCALCKRPLGSNWNVHHLIPKTFGGRVTVPMHRICHSKIHSVFTERELLKQYHTIEALLTHDAIAGFVKWVQNKHPDFHAPTAKDKRKRK
ncbi:MAG: hypothetical protein IM638_15170 [Bacteroidetes bacterium]|nr:hypothetical protein [Bacteroidota bacterium]